MNQQKIEQPRELSQEELQSIYDGIASFLRSDGYKYFRMICDAQISGYRSTLLALMDQHEDRGVHPLHRAIVQEGQRGIVQGLMIANTLLPALMEQVGGELKRYGEAQQ